jgi:T5SS/PEP-CTERM-associated repeat protein
MKEKMRRRCATARRSAALLVVASFPACPAVTRATTFTWDGSTTTGFGYFSEGGNWVGGTDSPNVGAPPAVPSGTTDLVFGSTNTHSFTPTMGMPYNISSLTFNSSALAFTIATDNLTIGSGGITDSSSNTETLSGSTNLVLSASQTWSVASNLTINGETLTNTSTSTLTKTGAGLLNLGILGSSGIGALSLQQGSTQLNSGGLSLSGAATTALSLSGGASLSINNSSVLTAHQVGDIAVIDDGGSSITVNGAASGLVATGASAEIDIGRSTSGSMTVSGGGFVTCGNYLVVGGFNNGNSGNLNISGGTVTAPYPLIGFANGSTGTVTVSNSGVLNATTNLEMSGNTIGGKYGGTSTLTISGGGVVNAAVTTFYSNNSLINVSGGTLNTTGLNSNASGNGGISLTDPTGGYALNLNGTSGSYTFSGTIGNPTLGSGTINKTGGSTQTLSGLLNCGGLQMSGGTLNLGGGNSYQNTIDNMALTGGTTTVSAPYLTSGSLAPITGSLIVNNNAQFESDGSATIKNGGNVTVTQTGDWYVDDNLTVATSGTSSVTATDGGFLEVEGNNGDIDVGILRIGAGNGAVGTVNISGGATASTGLVEPGSSTGGTGYLLVTGVGSMLNTNGANVDLGGYAGSQAGTGVVTVSLGGSINLGALNFESTTSTVNISGGTINATALGSVGLGTGSLQLSDPFGGYALNLSGASGSTTYVGSINGSTSTLATINMSGGSTEILTGAINNTSFIVNGGTLDIASPSAVENLGELSTTGGLFQISSGVIHINDTPSVEDIVTTGGTFNICNGAQVAGSDGQLQLSANGGTFNVTGTNTNVSNLSAVTIGAASPTTLNVNNGAFINASSATVNIAAGSGQVGTLYVGTNGVVTTSYLQMANTAGDTATAIVNGSGAVLTVYLSCELGGELATNQSGGNASLIISNGGAVFAPVINFLSNTSSINISGGTLQSKGLSSNASGNGAILLTDPSSRTALTIQVASGSETYSGTLSGTGTLLSDGAGTQIFTGTGSIGTLEVEGGVFNISGGSLGLTGTAPFLVNGGGLAILSNGAVLDSTSDTIYAQNIDGPTGTGMIVTGTGTQFNVGNGAQVGASNHGYLNISSGATVAFQNSCNVGTSSGSVGSMTINTGASATVVNNLYLGFSPGSTGTVLVSGSGSSLDIAGVLTIGGNGTQAGGSGTFTVTNSATASSLQGTNFESPSSVLNISGGSLTTSFLASLNSGYGAIYLSDPTSGYALNLNGGVANPITYSGTITGTGSINKSGYSLSIQILSGSVNTSGNAYVNGGNLTFNASGTSDVGSLQVNSGSSNISGGTLNLTNGSSFNLVNGSAASVIVSNGATLNAASDFGEINLNGGLSGGLTVTGTGSTYVGGDGLAVGNTSASTLTIQNGGLLTGTYYLEIGSSSQGKMVISSGGIAQCSNGILGSDSGGNGTATVTGNGSFWNCSGGLFVGGSVQIGGNSGTTGLLMINSSGAVQTSITDFDSNSATINISGGILNTGALSSYNTGNGTVKLLADPSGGYALNVNGNSGTNTYSGTITGSGTISKSGGSTQIFSGNINTSGFAYVNGGNLTFDASGTSTLSMLQVNSGSANISAGTLQLTTSTVGVSLVNGSAANVTISNGAVLLVTASGEVGLNGGLSGGLTVTGAGSTYVGGNELAVGATSPSTLTIQNGGAITGTYYFEIGSDSQGEMVISSGGIAQCSDGILGSYSVGNGTATVTGNGSVWNCSAGLYIGGAAQIGGNPGAAGLLTINSSGTVQTPITYFDSNSATINISAGTLNTGALTSLNTGNGTINLLANPAGGYALNINGSTGTNLYSGSITGAGSLEKTGGSTQILAGTNTVTGSVQVTAGILALSARNAINTVVVGGGTLMINGSGNILTVPTLAVTGGTVDLTTNGLDTGGSTLAAINALVKQGYNGGAWNGSGITSSAAAADARHLTAVGVIQNNQGGTPLYNSSHQFLSTTPAAADILVAYTYYGDTDLSGKVDGTDYSRIDAAFLADRSNPTADTGWFNGDFNYDGVVNGSDYTLIDNAFNQQSAQLSDQIADPTAAIADQAATASPVPEPVNLTIAVAAALGRARRPRAHVHSHHR